MFTSFSRMSRSFRMRDLGLLAIASLMMAMPAYPQQSGTSQAASGQSDNAALRQKIRDLEDRLIALEGQVRLLKSQAASPTTPSAATTETAAQAVPAAPTTAAPLSQAQAISLGGAGGSAAKALNPDISAIGDFIAVAGHNPVQPSPSLEMYESELGFQAIIDPYARGDFFLSFGESGVNLEEGYITFTALPAGFVAKVGKMRSAFGKVNTMHNHVLPWVDRPLVTTNLVGGEDGIDDAGFSLQRILPAPKGIFLEATGQVFRGGSDDVFAAQQRSDVSTVEHLRGYRDITESTNVDIGVSYARGHNNGNITVPGDFITQLYGVDATVRWKPLRRAIYHSFVGRSEFIWSQRQQFPREQRAFGMYASGDYQFGRRWFAGGRFDWSDRSQFDNLTDKGAAATLTYWPSEFSQLRGEYRFTRYAENRDSNELLMQLIFSLGAHGAHPF